MGDHAIFKIRYPAGTDASKTTRYDVWLTGNVPTSADSVGVNVDPGYGETIRVDCRAQGTVNVRARGPSGDFHSEPLRCVNCDDAIGVPSP